MNPISTTSTTSSDDGRTLPNNALEIVVENLYKSFGDHRVLKGVELTVHQGDLVAIVGGSGCGKTVLLRHMTGQLFPDRGRVLVADHVLPTHPLVDLSKLDEEGLDRIRKHWAIVFQRNALFSGTVFENIALWFNEVKGMSNEEVEPIAINVLKAVGFTSDVKSLLKVDRDKLSGGMAKRVAVARALSMDPILMFYDEPTTGLDPTLAEQIHNLILTTHRTPRKETGLHRTTVIITHDKDLLFRLQPRVVMLHEGKVHFDGAYVEFSACDSPVVRPYFELMPRIHEAHSIMVNQNVVAKP